MGPSGRKLRALLRTAGGDTRRYLFTNVVWCRPPNNATPDEATVEHCSRHNLKPLLEERRGVDVLAVGTIASQLLVGESISKAQGYIFRGEGDRWIYPVLHPQALVHQPTAEPATQIFIRRAISHEKPIELPRVQYNPRPHELAEFVAQARTGQLVVIDVETNPQMELTCLGIGTHTGEIMSTTWSPVLGPIVESLMSDRRIEKAGYHVRFDVGALAKEGLNVQGEWIDIIRLVQLDNRADYTKMSLEAVAPVYLPLAPWKGQRDNLLVYNARDVYYEWRILQDIIYRLFGTARYDLFRRTIRLERAVYDMEQRGFLIDVARLQEIKAAVQREAEEVKAEWSALTGGVNPNSPKQVKDFFKEKGIRFWKDNTGKETTDQLHLTLMAARDQLAARYVNPLLRIRYLSKLESTYLKTLVPDEDGILRTSIRITGAHTGRFSFAKPNLGNVPKYRDEFGLRNVFVARPGYLILSSDWSQAETRITAILADETEMLQAWKEGRDVHRLTASRIFGVTEAQVTKSQREIAKRVLYGLSYGAGATKVSEVAQIPRKDAATFINRFRVAFPAYFDQLEYWVAAANERGYLTNPFGRMLSFTGQDTKARNFVPQSTVADMMNIVICQLYEMLAGKRSKLLLQIYDQIIVEVAEDELLEVARLVRDVMNQPWPELKNYVIPADIEVGLSWGSVVPWRDNDERELCS